MPGRFDSQSEASPIKNRHPVPAPEGSLLDRVENAESELTIFREQILEALSQVGDRLHVLEETVGVPHGG